MSPHLMKSIIFMADILEKPLLSVYPREILTGVYKVTCVMISVPEFSVTSGNWAVHFQGTGQYGGEFTL